MDNVNHTGDATSGNEENFASMLEKSLTKRSRLEPGQKVEAVIVKISPEWIFLDLGGKGEGYLDKKELMDAAGELAVKEGDTIQAYFLSSDNNELHFTTKIVSGPAGRQQIEDAWRSEIPVEGTIVKEVKGGLEVKIAGSIRAFCPFSQTGIRREQNTSAQIGQSTTFKITEYNEKNIVLSRKAILEEEREKKKQELKLILKEGMKIKGTITSIQKFGAFVDIGGLEGLLPISEISWGKTDKVGDVLSVNQEVEVIIKGTDWEKDRISFSLKDALPNPWNRVADAYPVGSYHTGTVARLMPFGVFVTLEKGVDGLIHISKLGAGKRISHPKEVLKEGQSVEIKIEAVDQEKKKMSLSLAEISREEEEAVATLRNYQELAKETPKNLGNLGELLKAKMDQKNRNN
ncbi:MAG TPA: 30S ribosomal protein S1 [Nitrospirota bacterium]|nr:30S ribosomal protein S1 [Nitrospirota bacterium]